MTRTFRNDTRVFPKTLTNDGECVIMLRNIERYLTRCPLHAFTDVYRDSTTSKWRNVLCQWGIFRSPCYFERKRNSEVGNRVAVRFSELGHHVISTHMGTPRVVSLDDPGSSENCPPTPILAPQEAEKKPKSLPTKRKNNPTSEEKATWMIAFQLSEDNYNAFASMGMLPGPQYYSVLHGPSTTPPTSEQTPASSFVVTTPPEAGLPVFDPNHPGNAAQLETIDTIAAEASPNHGDGQNQDDPATPFDAGSESSDELFGEFALESFPVDDLDSNPAYQEMVERYMTGFGSL
ncbi:hypothetical protein BJ165DRAFT_8260 [Panaeolus papilionaceus]|nr:hypothetical protein BJ165DRAFT_8260 [Panaeolus papilionaceus]